MSRQAPQTHPPLPHWKLTLPIFPVWFWAVLLLGLAVRLYLAGFTEGTTDVRIWQDHASGIRADGLLGYYHKNEFMNHPPFMSLVVTALAWFAGVSGLSFGLLLRLPTVLADTGSLALLLRLLPATRYRMAAGSVYWLNPLTLIYSGYHGNTDSLLAFVLLLVFFFLSRGQHTTAALALGVSFWVKLPGLLLVPAFVFFLPNWRQRLRFSALAAAVGIATYLPFLVADPAVVWKNVFGYRGQVFQTPAGQPIWGMWIFLAHLLNHLSVQHAKAVLHYMLFYVNHDAFVVLGLILIWSWLRRADRTISQLALTSSGAFAFLYAFSSHWTWQYFAWSVPFWFLAGPWLGAVATLFAGSYIYGLYAYLCDNPWLLGHWDFLGHGHWPRYLELLRDAAWLFFIAGSCLLLGRAALAQATTLWERLHPTDTAPKQPVKSLPNRARARRA